MNFKVTILVLLFGVCSICAAARTVAVNDEQTESTTSAQPEVVVSMCVRSSNVTVRGWDKNQVTVRSTEGAQIELRRADSLPENQPAAKLLVSVLDQGDVQRTKRGCQANSDIEMHVPKGAMISIQTTDGDINIADVATAYVGTQDGGITIQKINKAVEVGTVGGDICLSDSKGRVDLNTIGGNIAISNVRSLDPSEPLEVTTVSGEIDLSNVEHSLLNVRTVNGNLKLTGPLARGGRYTVNTMSGDITFALPANASFKLSAKVASRADVITDFPLTLLSQTASGPEPANPPSPAPVNKQHPPSTPAPKAQAPATAPTSGAPPALPATPAPPAGQDENTIDVKPVIVHKQVYVDKKVYKVDPVIVSSYTSRRIYAVCGTGDATIMVSSFSGTLHLQKN